VIDGVHTPALWSGTAVGMTFTDCLRNPYVDPNDDASEDESYDPAKENGNDEDNEPLLEYDDANNTGGDNDADDIPIEGVTMENNVNEAPALNENMNENNDDDDDANADENTDKNEAHNGNDANCKRHGWQIWQTKWQAQLTDQTST
jgi:hypothetical protein